MTVRTTVALAVLGLLAAGTARAQTDTVAAGRQMAANQVGVMEFCQAQGYADADAVSAQRSAFARLPPAPAGAPPTDAAEALGRSGTLSMNGTNTTLASLAATHNTTVGGMCAQMAAGAKQAAAATQSMGTMPVMPGGIPAMPANPGALTAVPGLPAGMPAFPGAPSSTPR